TNVYSSKPEFLKEVGHDNPIMAFATRTAYQDLSIFPNPSNGLVNVGGVLEAGATLRVFDINGRLVMEKTVASEDVVLSFDLSGQPKGVYTVQMVGTQYHVTRKFVIE
ncbi:MAG: T9SS type A sorting domain-containing protein, partial [Saprospiraceae bacterium]|nr:T9SS type A sorting domain-containing protein [Saprospiraceae bacterium]